MVDKVFPGHVLLDIFATISILSPLLPMFVHFCPPLTTFFPLLPLSVHFCRLKEDASQEEKEEVTNSGQKQSKVTKSYQKFQNSAEISSSRQKLPKVTKNHQKRPQAGKSGQKVAEAASNEQKWPKSNRTSFKLAKKKWTTVTKKPQRSPKSGQKQSMFTKCDQKVVEAA
eukprot:EG_transcript_18632